MQQKMIMMIKEKKEIDGREKEEKKRGEEKTKY